MIKNKIGSIFLISILALAGIGISYAGFTDSISIYGTVSTATVELEIEEYSGTWVWKVWAIEEGAQVPPGEVYIFRGFIDDKPTIDEVRAMFPDCEVELEASAYAQDGSNHGGKEYDIDMVWEDIFPCIDFTADVVLAYTGTIPSKMSWPIIEWHQGRSIFFDYVELKAFKYTISGDDLIKGDEITSWPYQVHNGYYVGFEVTIHIPQLNSLQNQHGEFSFNINVIQWNDQCGDTPSDDKVVNIPPGALMTIQGPYPSGWSSYIKTHIYGIGDEGWVDQDEIPYNVWNGYWLGWCVDEDHNVYVGPEYDIDFYSSYDDSMPDPCKDPDWPYVNWVINNKGGATPEQIQKTIWFFVNGGWNPYNNPAHPNYDPVIQGLIDGAYNNPDGLGYVPGEGMWVAVICWIDNAHQITIIEVDP